MLTRQYENVIFYFQHSSHSKEHWWSVFVKQNNLALWLSTLSAPTPQIGQTYLNNSSAKADEFFEYVWSFYGVGT